MNPYAVIGSGMGTAEAASLGVRLSAWHDAMVAHERLLRSTSSKDRCDDECPHAEAGALWTEALETFGPRAHELTFLYSRAAEVIDVSQPRKTNRTAAEVLASLAGAVGVVLLAPLAILAVGTPIAAAVRGLVEVIAWVFGLGNH